jgi:hypothetical protein
MTRPPLGTPPGELPGVKRNSIPVNTVVWGMLPIGVPHYGRCVGKNGRCKPTTSEYVVCFAWINEIWHEVT